MSGLLSNSLFLSTAAAAGGLQISRSLRFNSSDSAYLSRVVGTAGNRTTWTWSGWVKRSKIGNQRFSLFCAGNSGSDETEFFFQQATGADKLVFYYYPGSYTGFCETLMLFRDTAAWYHIVLALDTTQGTASDRCKIYVNGVQQSTSFTSNFGLSATPNINSTAPHQLGRSPTEALPFDGYLANIHFIDGQALTPSSFTETDATTGQLIPKTYTGSYGTNGFNLLFADNSSNTASTLGKDYSGLGNNWTPNNLSVTAGAGNDSLVDSPTNYGTDTGVGGTVRGNYCTFNPIDKGSSVGLSNGNLQFTESGGGPDCGRATFAIPSSGKWYWETLLGAVGSGCNIGIATGSTALTAGGALTGVLYQFSGYVAINGWGSSGAYGGAYTTNDLIGIAVDMDTGTITFYKNGTSLGAAYSSLSAAIQYFPFFQGTTTTWIANFGQRPFAYTAPSGFKALCTQNLPTPLVTKSSSVFDVITYTGTGSSLTLPNGSSTPTSIAFTPDFVWLKGRSGATDHALYDVVRGVQNDLVSNSSAAETTQTTGLTAFGTNTFTVGSLAKLNTSSATYVGWAWDAGTGSPVSNPDGSITSQVRANATAGFSVSTWTGTATAGTVGHGLGVAPEFIIVKNRSVSDAWYCYHKSLGNAARIQLNETSAQTTGSSQWNSTSPTSTVYSVGSGSWHASGNLIVSYNFAPVVGYNSFGSYTANGSTDGPFVYTGFRPRWVLLKRSDSTENWIVIDTARDSYNLSVNNLFPSQSIAEQASASLDILSNGFKLKSTSTGGNTSGGTYIYAAFAEMPFNYARAR